jgi:hypothetical protein
LNFKKMKSETGHILKLVKGQWEGRRKWTGGPRVRNPWYRVTRNYKLPLRVMAVYHQLFFGGEGGGLSERFRFNFTLPVSFFICPECSYRLERERFSKFMNKQRCLHVTRSMSRLRSAQLHIVQHETAGEFKFCPL